MTDRRKRSARGTKARKGGQPEKAARSASRRGSGVEVLGWTILAHPLFLAQLEKLVVAAEREAPDSVGGSGPNAKLLAHLLDLAFDKIPRDPGSPVYRHGGTLGDDRKNWFRAKTGNGRYRLFYRFQSSARLIVYAWVNDESSLRTYGSRTDAYSVFARMLDAGNPPDDWDILVASASDPANEARLQALTDRKGSRSGPGGRKR
ncbi:MAG TPA: type II toxin-antitoxin system YhaV family toxin [Gemmatimonadaceae bacterium]|jgi:Toxin with endonuclease activity YhaV.